MAFAYCPDCVARIYVGHKPWLGQPVTCDSCYAELEVVELNPPALDWADSSDDDGDWTDDRQTEELERA
jgi:lysine biosynthesis protein LysW